MVGRRLNKGERDMGQSCTETRDLLAKEKSPSRGDSRIQVTGKWRRFFRLSEHRVISVEWVEGC